MIHNVSYLYNLSLSKKTSGWKRTEKSVAYEETQSPIFLILCVLCFERQSFLTFILL